MIKYLLTLVIQFIKERLGNSLARPRIVKYETGEIILKNLSPEECDRITLLVKAPAAPKPELVKEIDKTIVEIEKSVMTDVAICLRKNNKGSYEIVTVGFNDKKEASVLEVKDVGPHKAIASGMFRVEVSNKYL